MKKILLGLFFLMLVAGCGKKALPMSKAEILAITHGKKFNATYYAEWSGYRFACSRMDDDKKKIFNTLWGTGIYGSWELYTYAYGYVSVQNVNTHDKVFFFESSARCDNFVTAGGSRSIDVYVH